MTESVCKACGNYLGEIEDFEPGDYTTCDECGIGYDFQSNPHKQADYEELIDNYANEGETHDEAFARLAESDQSLDDLRDEYDSGNYPLMVKDPETMPARVGSAVSEVVSVDEVEEGEETREVVTYLREDGVRVKEYKEDFDGEVDNE